MSILVKIYNLQQSSLYYCKSVKVYWGRAFSDEALAVFVAYYQH